MITAVSAQTRITTSRRTAKSLSLILLLMLCVSANACIIAKYEFDGPTIQIQRTDQLLQYDPPVSIVIPQHELVHECPPQYIGSGPHPCEDVAGSRLTAGVTVALRQAEEHGQRFPVDFSAAIPSKGLACVISVLQKSDEDYMSQLASLLTLFVIPAYTTREYVLSYQFMLNFKEVRLYQYRIREKALSGLFMWLFVPAGVFENVAIGQWEARTISPGSPLSLVIRKATSKFLQDAYQDGMMSPIARETRSQ